MRKHLFFLCMTLLSSTFVFAQNYAQNFGTGNGDGRSWDNTVFQTATDGTKTVAANFNHCCPIKSIECKKIVLGHCIFSGRA